MFYTMFQQAHLLHVIVLPKQKQTNKNKTKIKNIQALDRKTTKPNPKQIGDSFFIVFHRSTVV